MSPATRSPSREADLRLRDRCLGRPAARQAWNDLYRRYAPIVRARILFGRRAFPDHEVDDAVQTVFLRLATGALARFEGRASLRGYIVTLADSVRISENRRRMAVKRGRGRTLSLDHIAASAQPGETGPAGEHPSLAGAANPETIYMDKARSDDVRRAVSDLEDPRDREIVSLYFADEPCVDREIARRLGMPLNTVTWRRLKALRELKRRLTALEGRP